MYEEREKYPVNSGFQIAYAVDGGFGELTGTRVFSCEPLKVGSRSVYCMSVQSYDYDPDFAPEGKMILQSNFSQTEEDYRYWEVLYADKEAYRKQKIKLPGLQWKEWLRSIRFWLESFVFLMYGRR